VSLLLAGHAALAGHAVLADSDTGKGSPIGLFVVLLLVIAVYFLYRSLSRHLRNLPESFDKPAEPNQAEPSQATESNRAAGPARAVAPPETTEPTETKANDEAPRD
jgi:hypothetical protein